ncbi:acyltransferase [Novosphingobium sp. PC22D]|uniref:acyltransferase family protein n=1 Tax=Novosphingobium sp. PC22D TaxID=1962403 RepID=UPI000BF001E8|nr:acyltransferase [Novosphingobium sp. PC22D]PEQ11520.1 acyltransferase [Novosphingobium sp. PC22D]
MTGSQSARHYGMDWLRIAAFILLIFYHIGFMFTPWGYQTPSRGVVDGVAVFLLALSPWRLSLLFAISGYASAAMLERQPGRGTFLRNRFMRLAVPLVFGILVIVPPQPWVGMMRDTGYSGGYYEFLAHYYRAFNMVDGIPVPRWIHLWFVAYLLAYTVAFCGLLALPEALRAWLARLCERVLAGPLLLPLPIMWIFVMRLLLRDGWTDTHNFVNDFAAHACYFPMFLFGVLLRRSEPLREAIAGQWMLASVFSLAGYAVIFVIKTVYPNNTPVPADLDPLFMAARAVLGWAAIVALFGIADRYWNHDAPLRATLAEAVFPFYIVHQTVYIGAGWLINDAGFGALGEFLFLVGATAIGCVLFYLIGREIGPLRPFIGLGIERKVGRRRAQPAAP